MNNFGLGLILSFTDNATSGMRNATGAFNELNQSVTAFSNANGAEAALLQISTAAGIVGNELFNVGQGITSLFSSIIQNINNVGSTMLSARTQLSTLYGDAVAGQRVLDQIKDYSAKSIFNFEDLIPSVIMLKANGIEAFDQIATSAYRASNGMEGTAQTLMDYAADLAAFNPQMHNMYGTGVQAAMGALNEYIAEGNARSLKTGASLDITQLLGEEKGKTIEERSRQVADLIEQLGMVGMTANLAGTPMQRLANVEDVFFNLMSQISDSGVFEKYSSLIEKFTDYLFSIPDEELEQMAQIIAESIVEIMDPLEKVLDLGFKAVDWIRDLVKQNPEIVKTTLKGIALAGAILLISGASLKLISALGRLKFSMSMLFGGNLMTNGLKVLGLLKNLALYVLPIIAAVGLLKLMWDRDFMGMQERVKTFVQETIDTFKLLFDAWGDYTLSEENFEKAREMGLLPLIEAVLQLKYHLGFLIEGFKTGFEAFFEQLGAVLVKMGLLDDKTHGFRDIITQLLEKMTAPGLTDNWERIGYLLGNIAGWLLVVLAILPTIMKVVGIVVNGVKIILKIVSVVKTIYGFLSKAGILADIVKLVTKISDLLPIILEALGGISAGTLLLIVLALALQTAWTVFVIYAFVYTIKHWDKVKSYIISGIDTLKEKFWSFIDYLGSLYQNLYNWFASTPIGSVIIGTIQNIVNRIRTAILNTIAFWSPLVKAIMPIVITVWSTFFKIVTAVIKIVLSVYGIIWNFYKSVGEIVGAIFIAVLSVLKRVFSVTVAIVLGIWKVIKSVAGLIKNIAYVVYEVVRIVVLATIIAFNWLKDRISEILSAIGEFFGTVFSWIYDHVISPVINAIATAFEWLSVNVVTPVGMFFTDIFEGIAEIVTWLKDDVFIPVFTNIKDYICDAISKAADFVNPIIESIADGISWVADKLSAIIDTASKFFGDIGGSLENVGDGLSEMVGLSTGGYVKTAGIAVLHPNEVVVNDVLTKNLGAFLNDYATAKDRTSPLVTQDIVVVDDNYKERDDNTPVYPMPDPTRGDDTPSPIQNYVQNSTNDNSTTESNEVHNDNSVVFESGSVVFNMPADTDISNMSEEELNDMAEKLMKIITRKMQLRNMQTRK